MRESGSGTGKVLALLFFGVLMGALDIAIVGPALPAIQSTFHVDDRHLSWIFSVYVLMNLVGTPLMAKLSDVFGRRVVYVADVVLFGLGSLAVAAAPSFAVLLAGRAVQGFGAGGIFPVASAVIGDTFPPERRGRALGLIGAVFGIAFLVGPVIGGVLLLAGWRWLFVVNLPVAAVLVVASLRILPDSRAATRRPFDVAGIAVLAVALAAVTLGLTRLDTHDLLASLEAPVNLSLLVGGAVLLVVFALLERRAPDPIVRPGLLARRQVILAAVFSIGAGLAEAATVFLPAYAVNNLGVSESTASFMLLSLVLAMSVGAPLAGRLLDRVGSKPVVFTGLVLMTGGFVLFSRFGQSLLLFHTAGAIMGLGLAALLGAPLRYILLAEAEASERGAAQGVLTLFTGGGQLLGAALLGAIIASGGGGTAGYSDAFVRLADLTAVLVVLAVFLKGRKAELAAARRAEAREAPDGGAGAGEAVSS